MLPATLKGFSAFIDGRGYLGKLSGGALPKLAIKTEEWRDGGMDAAIELDMGMGPMEMPLTFGEYSPDILALFGLLGGRTTIMMLRGSAEDEAGRVSAIECACRGLFKEMDPGSWSAGGKAELKVTGSLRFYRLTIDGRLLHEIDPENVVRIIDGVDQLAARRAALGV